MAVVHFINRYEDLLDAWAKVSDSWERARREQKSRRCSGTPQLTPQRMPQSTPKSTPQSTPQSTQQSPSAQQPFPTGSKRLGGSTSDVRRILGLDQSNDLEDLALIDRLSILKGPQPIRIASENSSQRGLSKSKYATHNTPAVPGARLQGHSAVPDKTPSKPFYYSSIRVTGLKL